MVDSGNFIDVAIDISTPATIKFTEALIISKAGASILWSLVRSLVSGLVKLAFIFSWVVFGSKPLMLFDNQELPLTIPLESMFG